MDLLGDPFHLKTKLEKLMLQEMELYIRLKVHLSVKAILLSVEQSSLE